MTETILSVPEIHCDHCKSSIESAVAELDGVETALVDIEGRTVAVSYEPNRVDLESIRTAVESQGYVVEDG